MLEQNKSRLWFHPQNRREGCAHFTLERNQHSAEHKKSRHPAKSMYPWRPVVISFSICSLATVLDCGRRGTAALLEIDLRGILRAK